MKKIILSAAALAAITVAGQQKDSLQVKDVDEVVLTASRKKKA
uniref:TonB-dependent receptor n=1 Tax=Chryseobacterium endophyticum TaxID=1854762 RepID=A0AAU6WRF2_9FLAO